MTINNDLSGAVGEMVWQQVRPIFERDMTSMLTVLVRKRYHRRGKLHYGRGFLVSCGLGGMDKPLDITIWALMLALTVTIFISPLVYAQTTGDIVRTEQWCEQKKDELKDRLTELMLFSFKKGVTLNEVIDMRDKGDALVVEAEQRMVDCADYLARTEMQTLQQVHDGAALFSCILDTDREVSQEFETKLLTCLASVNMK
jgi:hypothetical protein